MNEAPITVEDFREWFSAHPEYAERKNQLDVYTDFDGTHCLIGQYLTDTDRYCPSYESHSNRNNVKTIFPNASETIQAMQLAADNGYSWGSIVSGHGY